MELEIEKETETKKQKLLDFYEPNPKQRSKRQSDSSILGHQKKPDLKRGKIEYSDEF